MATVNYTQSALPGMAPPQKPRQLSLLFWEAAASHYGPIADRLEREGRIGPDGITAEDLEGEAEFASLEDFRADLDRRGVAYREGR